MPNVALEALALGKAVIASPEAGGVHELPSVVCAPAGKELLAAMHAVPVCPNAELTALRPSLLPTDHTLQGVCHEFNSLLQQQVTAYGAALRGCALD